MAGPTVVAVLGAGSTMGYPMAANMVSAGMTVRAWNRSRSKAESLSGQGAAVCDSPAQAADGADVVVTMLADADAVTGVMADQGALDAMRDDAVWLQMSTIGEEGAERCARLATERGVGYVDAPVLGTRQPAERRALVILASGPDQLQDRVAPVFGAVGSKTIWAGPAGAGTRLKLVTNSWVLAVVEAGAETIALAEGLGLDPQLFFDAIEGGALDLPYLRMKASVIAQRDFTPSFRLTLAAKDARLVDQAAQARRLDLPVPRAIASRLAEGAREHGDEDFSATYLTSAPRSAA